MKKKKLMSALALFVVLTLNFAFLSTTYALDCIDTDDDGYIVLDSGDLDFNGDYSEEEWDFYFEAYKEGGMACDGINFKKGAEPERCDAVNVVDRNVLAKGSILGKKVHPGAIDGPNNGIDEDCDGADGEYIAGAEDTADPNELLNKIINMLSLAVGGISTIVLLWGGMMYASAAGDDTKTTKAIKAMKGAILGLLVALAARVIIGFVIDKLL